MTTPKQFRTWASSAEAWGKYRDLLEFSTANLQAGIDARLARLAAQENVALGGQFYRDWQEETLRFINAEYNSVASTVNAPTNSVFSTRADMIGDDIGRAVFRQPALTAGFSGAFSRASGLVIANYDVDLGKKLPALVSKNRHLYQSTIKDAIKDSRRRILAGEITGLPVDSIVRDLKINVLGLRPYQRVGGLSSTLRTVVRTNLAGMNNDVWDGYARSEKQIVGVEIQRGPGECRSNACGALGVSEGEIATFLYSIGPPPTMPFHPNDFCMQVGFVFADDPEYKHSRSQGLKAQAQKHIDQNIAGHPLYEGSLHGRAKQKDALTAYQQGGPKEWEKFGATAPGGQ